MASVECEVDCGVDNCCATYPSVVGKEDWGWDTESNEEKIIPRGSKETKATVCNCEPAVEFVICRELIAIPTPENIKASEDRKSEEIRESMVGDEWDVGRQSYDFVDGDVNCGVFG